MKKSVIKTYLSDLLRSTLLNQGEGMVPMLFMYLWHSEPPSSRMYLPQQQYSLMVGDPMEMEVRLFKVISSNPSPLVAVFLKVLFHRSNAQRFRCKTNFALEPAGKWSRIHHLKVVFKLLKH